MQFLVRNIRRFAVVVILLGATAAIVLLSRVSPTSEVPSPAIIVSSKLAMPSVVGNSPTSSWFCPGVPGRDKNIKSEIVVANPTQVPITGTISILSNEEPDFSTTVIIAPLTRGSFDATQGRKSQYMSAIVELDSGQASVEQRIIHPAGDSISLCANQTSDRWFFADGFTGAESSFEILLTNPFPDATVVDLSFVTIDGSRQPAALKGMVLPARSVTGISMGDQGARNEATLAVSVRATSGRFIAGKLQHFLGRGRLGFTSALGASSTSRQWWFAAGEKGPGIDEQLVVFNPTQIDQTVSIAFLTGAAEALLREPLVLSVPAGRVTTLSTSSLPVITDGRYGIFVSSVTNDFVTSADNALAEFVVVEQVVSKTIGKKTGTSVILGAPYGSPSRTWTSPSGLVVGDLGSLVIANTTSLDATLRVSTIGPSGAAPIVGLEQVALAGASVVSIQIPLAIAQLQILVESDTEVIVQREVSRGHQLLGSSAVLALPYRLLPTSNNNSSNK